MRRLNSTVFANDSELLLAYTNELHNLNDKDNFQMDKLIFIRAKEGQDIKEITLNDNNFGFTFPLPVF